MTRRLVTFATLVGLILLGVVLALAVLQAGLGHGPGGVVLVSHDRGDCEWDGTCGRDDYDQNYGSKDDRNRNRDRNRGAFSPGPFDRSPIDFSGSCISLNCSGRDDRRRQEEER